jgi:hypothetical protein
MRSSKRILWSLLLLAGCGGNPFVDGGVIVDPGTPGSLAVPAVVKGNLNSASYTPGSSTISVNITALDATALSQTYARNATYDVGGYQAYTYQASTSNRYVLALVKATNDVKGLVAVDGGQFGTYHAGGDFVRITAFSLPAAGVAGTYNYSGSYVGLMNIGTPVPGPGGALNPTRAYRTTGDALITADFTDMLVSGGVDARTIVDPLSPSGGLAIAALPSFDLHDGQITSTGTFAGKVYIGQDAVGDYAGLFAGLNASEIAMLLVFNPLDDSSIFEHGLIVLDNCVDAGGPKCP